MTSRINNIANNHPQIRTGIGGNVYAICKRKAPLESLCKQIGKAVSSIYWHTKHECWAFRIKAPHHKKQISIICPCKSTG